MKERIMKVFIALKKVSCLGYTVQISFMTGPAILTFTSDFHTLSKTSITFCRFYLRG